jgi:putative Mn2+ efflux pump MntP
MNCEKRLAGQGCFFGKQISRIFGNKAKIIGGLILIGIGAYAIL